MPLKSSYCWTFQRKVSLWSELWHTMCIKSSSCEHLWWVQGRRCAKYFLPNISCEIFLKIVLVKYSCASDLTILASLPLLAIYSCGPPPILSFPNNLHIEAGRGHFSRRKYLSHLLFLPSHLYCKWWKPHNMHAVIVVQLSQTPFYDLYSISNLCMQSTMVLKYEPMLLTQIKPQQ